MAQGPEVSRHSRDWSFWNSSLGLWSALGRKLQDNPVLPTEVSGETFLVVFLFCLSSLFSPFSFLSH